MALESVPYGTGLNTANPPNTDQRKQGDDHLRLIKTAVLQSLQLMGGGFTTAGTATALTVTTNHVNAPTYQDGHLYAFALHTNIGIAATINFDAIGARTLKKRSAGAWVDVAASDFLSGDILLCYYEAGDSTMRIITPAAAAAAAVPYLPLTGGTLTGILNVNAAYIAAKKLSLSGASVLFVPGAGFLLELNDTGTVEAQIGSGTAAATVRWRYSSPTRSYSAGLVGSSYNIADETAAAVRLEITSAGQVNVPGSLFAGVDLQATGQVRAAGGDPKMFASGGDPFFQFQTNSYWKQTIGDGIVHCVIGGTDCFQIAGTVLVHPPSGVTFVNATGHLVLRQYANFAALPSAASFSGSVVQCMSTTTPGTGALAVTSDGTNWRDGTGTAVN